LVVLIGVTVSRCARSSAYATSAAQANDSILRVPKLVEVSAPRLFRLRPRRAVGTSGSARVTSCCLRDRTSDR
jgi:hypothetical protein